MARKQAEMIEVRLTTASAVEAAKGLIEEAANDLQESVDAVAGTNFENTERYQNWGDAASSLEAVDFEIDFPGNTGEIEIVTMRAKDEPKGMSKVGRNRFLIEQAVANLNLVIGHLEACDEVEDDNEVSDIADAVQAIIDELESIDL